MGRIKQHKSQSQDTVSQKTKSKSNQPSTPLVQGQLPADLSQLSGAEQILALQRQIGNRSVSRLLEGDGGAIQRAPWWEGEQSDEANQADQADQANQGDQGDQAHEVDVATYEQMSARAKKLAERLQNILESNYSEMIKDETGMKAINVAGQVEKYLKWAFTAGESYADEYIGSEHLPLVMEQINAVPGLYDKLGLLYAMEPFHARTVGSHLGIPKLEGFHYNITTVSASGGDTVVGADTAVIISCDQDGRELWEQDYAMRAIGVGVGKSVEPVTITAATGEFDTLVFWGPGDFQGEVRLGSASAGLMIGYSFGVGTFMGDGSKGSLTIDMSGKIATTGEIGISAFIGYMAMVGSGKRSGMPKEMTADMQTKIKVTEEIDKEMTITFPDQSDKAGGSFKEDFLEFLAHALTAERLLVTINGFSTPDKSYNVDLMKKRIKSTRKLIDAVVKEKKIEPERVQINEIETIKNEEPGRWKDPPRDRITKVHLKGTITVRSPGE